MFSVIFQFFVLVVLSSSSSVRSLPSAATASASATATASKSSSFIANTNYRNLILAETAKTCLIHPRPFVCFKESVLRLLNEAIIDNKAIEINEYVKLIKDPNFGKNYSLLETNRLASDLNKRDEQISELLVRGVNDFFQSRTLTFNMPNDLNLVDESRKKKDYKKYGGMYLMMGMGMATMMMKLALSKIAFMAGTALITAKIALVISTIVALKKLLSSPTKSEVVVTSQAEHGAPWHRSLVKDDESSDLPYRAHVPSNY